MNNEIPTVEIKSMKRTWIQSIWYGLFRLLGWDLTGRLPTVPKYVVIVAPHTSSWDVPIGFIASRSFPFGFPYWMAKDSLFRWPLGPIIRALGAIAVNRRSSHNYVQQIVDEFAQRDVFLLALAPEGTRSKTEYWKSGFYHIALAANVPVSMAFLDFEHKLVGFGPTIMLSGDVEADMAIIRDFYSGIKGYRPELQGEVRLRPPRGH